MISFTSSLMNGEDKTTGCDCNRLKASLYVGQDFCIFLALKIYDVTATKVNFQAGCMLHCCPSDAMMNRERLFP